MFSPCFQLLSFFFFLFFFLFPFNSISISITQNLLFPRSTQLPTCEQSLAQHIPESWYVTRLCLMTEAPFFFFFLSTPNVRLCARTCRCRRWRVYTSRAKTILTCERCECIRDAADANWLSVPECLCADAFLHVGRCRNCVRFNHALIGAIAVILGWEVLKWT